MDEDEPNNMEIFEKDFIELIDIKKVCSGFKKAKSFEELKENEAFRNLFKNVEEEIYLEDAIADCGEEFVTTYARDIFLMAKWYESMHKEGKTTKFINSNIDNLVIFYIHLLRYVGGCLHDLNASSIQEVFEVGIIKAEMTPKQISSCSNTIKRFNRFLEKNKVKNVHIELLDEKDINNLKRVAHEFKIGAWGHTDEDYLEWRDHNIIYYM